MDEKWKELIKTVNALMALGTSIGVFVYALVRTVQLLASSY